MITCDKHDHIEIACMYRIEVTLKLKAHNEISGTAIDTRLNTHREECLVLSIGNGEQQEVALSDISVMQATTKNPHFDRVDIV